MPAGFGCCLWACASNSMVTEVIINFSLLILESQAGSMHKAYSPCLVLLYAYQIWYFASPAFVLCSHSIRLVLLGFRVQFLFLYFIFFKYFVPDTISSLAGRSSLHLVALFSS